MKGIISSQASGLSCSSLATKGEQVPAEALDPRSWERVEGPDEQTVVHGPLPSPVQTRLDRKTLRGDLHLIESGEQLLEFADAELENDRRILMLQPHLHQLRQCVQPGYAVIDLKDCQPVQREHATAFVDQPLWVGRVLNDAVCVDEIERLIRKRKPFAGGDSKLTRYPLLREVGPGKVDRRRGDVDPGNHRSPFGKSCQIDGSAAADLENAAAGVSVKRDEPQEMMELFEMILIEIVEEAPSADRLPADFEIVNMTVPVLTDCVDRH